MGLLRALRDGFAEVFALRAAERTVAAYGPERLERIRASQGRARSLLRAARRLADPRAAIVLLGRALPDALAAVHDARGDGSPLSPDDEIDWLERASASPPPEEWLAAARASAAPPDFADAETQRDRLEALVASLLVGVESRTPLELRFLRAGRALAVLVALVAVGWPFVRHHWLVHDVALHAHVTTSPLRFNPPSGAELVDGHTHGTFGVHTLEGRPWVVVDLDRVWHVRDVRVYNRGDGWFDDVLPLTLSVSTDGVHYETVATRTVHFDVWDVSLDHKPARFVRLSKDNGYIALNAIEVFARD